MKLGREWWHECMLLNFVWSWRSISTSFSIASELSRLLLHHFPEKLSQNLSCLKANLLPFPILKSLYLDNIVPYSLMSLDFWKQMFCLEVIFWVCLCFFPFLGKAKTKTLLSSLDKEAKIIYSSENKMQINMAIHYSTIHRLLYVKQGLFLPI